MPCGDFLWTQVSATNQQQIISENLVFSAGSVCDFIMNEFAFCRCVGI